MESLGIAIPLLPGKTEEWRRFAEVKGPRRSEMDEFHRRAGVTENWYLQRTPQGDILVHYLEGENLARSMQTLAASDHPLTAT